LIDQALVDRPIAIVIDRITDFSPGQDLANTAGSLALATHPIPGPAGSDTFRFGLTRVATLADSIQAEAIFIYIAITVIIAAITIFIGRQATAAALVHDAFVNMAVTVIVREVTDFLSQVAALAARIQDTFVGRAITVIITAVANFSDGGTGCLAGAQDAIATNPVPAPTSTDASRPVCTGITGHRFALGTAASFFDNPVTIVVESIAALFGLTGVCRCMGIIAVGTGFTPLSKPIAISIDTPSGRRRIRITGPCISAKSSVRICSRCSSTLTRNVCLLATTRSEASEDRNGAKP
jgi:hypothetical protein